MWRWLNVESFVCWQLTNVIKKLNEDATVHGMIVQVSQYIVMVCYCYAVLQSAMCQVASLFTISGKTLHVGLFCFELLAAVPYTQDFLQCGPHVGLSSSGFVTE